MNKVTLIVVGGFAGGGKTTLANKLSRSCGIPIFSSDSINDAMRPALNMDFHTTSPASHEVMWHLARCQLANGVSVVLDTPMCNEKSWQQLDKLKDNLTNVKVLTLLLHTELSIHKERIDMRGLTNTEHLNLGGDSFEDITFKHEIIENLDRVDVIKIDANATPEQIHKRVVALLNNQPTDK